MFEDLVRNTIVNASLPQLSMEEEVSWCREPFQLLVLVSWFTGYRITEYRIIKQKCLGGQWGKRGNEPGGATQEGGRNAPGAATQEGSWNTTGDAPQECGRNDPGGAVQEGSRKAPGSAAWEGSRNAPESAVQEGSRNALRNVAQEGGRNTQEDTVWETPTVAPVQVASCR